MVYAVILSGGIGTRTGYDIPKQFIKINQKPLLAYCIEKFVMFDKFKKIIVSSPEEYLDETKELIMDYFPDEERIVVIVGGKTRQQTLMKSIDYVNKIKDSEDAIIVNHDAARIFVSPDQIKKCIEFTEKHGASSPVIPSTDVIVEARDNDVLKMPNRYDMFHVQTPQGFRINEYLDLYSNLSPEEIESVHEIIRVYFLNDKDVYLFEGDKNNFKVTTSTDIKISKAILKDYDS